MAKLAPEACRAGRTLLRWGVRDLAAAAGVGVVTVARFEGGEEIREATLDKLKTALEASGVDLTNGRGTGARLLREERGRSLETSRGFGWHNTPLCTASGVISIFRCACGTAGRTGRGPLSRLHGRRVRSQLTSARTTARRRGYWARIGARSL